MGATSVKSRVLDLLSELVVDNTAIGQFASDAAKEIINVLPIELLWSMSTTTADNNNAGAAVTAARILSVSRAGFTAREIPYSDKARYLSDESIYKATNTSPIYYKNGGKVYVVPKAANTTTCLVETVLYPTIVFSQDLGDFVGAPDEIEPLIIMKTAIKARLSELNEYQDDTEEHNLKLADLQVLQREYEGALAVFIATLSRPDQRREEQ